MARVRTTRHLYRHRVARSGAPRFHQAEAERFADAVAISRKCDLPALVASYRDTAPKLAARLGEKAPEGLAVFTLPQHQRKRMRTHQGLCPFRAETCHWRVSETPFTPMERSVQKDLKRPG